MKGMPRRRASECSQRATARGMRYVKEAHLAFSDEEVPRKLTRRRDEVNIRRVRVCPRAACIATFRVVGARPRWRGAASKVSR